MHSPFSYPCYMPCPLHPPWFDYSNYTWRRVQAVKLLIMQFSSASTSLHLTSVVQIFSSLQFCTILIFIFLDSRREDIRSCTGWWQALPKFYRLLISFLIRFSYVIIVPKYFWSVPHSQNICWLYAKNWSAFWWCQQHILSLLCVYF
jgi:hypothetical protein